MRVTNYTSPEGTHRLARSDFLKIAVGVRE
jgi:hypothetical protein